MFRVVASDLDGTLLAPDNRFTSFTKNILKLLTARNIHLVFATGRYHTNVMQICENCKVSAYIITSNGAKIHNPYKELIFSCDFETEIVSDLLSIAYHDKQIITNVFYQDKWLVSRHKLRKDNFFDEYGFNYNLYKKDSLPLDNICKIYFTSNNYQRLLSLEKELNFRWGSRVNISFSFSTCLEVMPGGVSKGFALKQVVNLLGCELKDCISFGDGMNDKEMLSMTGKGCIMSNAQQRLKDALPFLEVIGSNKDEAVPRYLHNIYCISN